MKKKYKKKLKSLELKVKRLEYEVLDLQRVKQENSVDRALSKCHTQLNDYTKTKNFDEY